MGASRYRRFLKLCEEWPVDETKRGRDLGAYLRQRVAQAFREGENTQVTRLWGPPAAGRRLGRGEERRRQGGAHERPGGGAPRMRAPFLPGRAYLGTLLTPRETAESGDPIFYSVLSPGCTLEVPEELFKNLDTWDHSTLLNQNLGGVRPWPQCF